MQTWIDKAHRIIGDLCRQSYLQANTRPNGELYTKHYPYSVPETAQELIECLNTDDEARAKAIFIRIACTGH